VGKKLGLKRQKGTLLNSLLIIRGQLTIIVAKREARKRNASLVFRF